MSIIIQPGLLISYMESEVTCPICTFVFDASDKIAKAKNPYFKTKCPACKGSIGISMPIFGGTTKCFEWNSSKNVPAIVTETPNKVNGKVITKPLFDNNEDEQEQEQLCK